MGILLMSFGLLMLLAAVKGKDFHAADVLALGEYPQRMSNWLGRLIFSVVGVGLIIIGVKLTFFSS